MNTTRRQALLSGLFGAGYVGLRALATGLPISVLLDPHRALAQSYDGMCADKSKAQYVILNTLATGDPLNANVPGSYDHPDILHPADPLMAKTAVVLAGKTYQGAKPWAGLPQWVRDRAAFIHHATLTNAHPNQPKVMRLMGAIKRQEMLMSLLAKNLAPCLGTVQREPAVVGANGPSEALSFEGRSLPVVPPLALKGILISPKGPLTDLQKLRDQDLNRINGIFKKHGTLAQRAFLDDMARTQTEVRSIAQDLLTSLDGVVNNGPDGQMVAALALIRMNVAPVVSIRFPFGGDNHADPMLARETAETVAGVANIGKLLEMVRAAGLQDQVTMVCMNVFGRTLTNRHRAEAARQNGRDHYASHHCTVLIGKAVKGGVYGGVGVRTAGADVGAMPIDSRTGKASPSGDISFDDTLAAVGKTVGAAAGVGRAVLDDQITAGKVIQAAMA
jgi:hypothetical protein